MALNGKQDDREQGLNETTKVIMRLVDSRNQFERIALIVLDSAGIGEMPDAARFGDAGSDTLGHIFSSIRVHVPHLQALGLGNIRPMTLAPVASPSGSFGKAAIASDGKDTTIGHWEIAGLITDRAFPTYPNGFPPNIVSAFEQAIERKIIGNKAASGTEIIDELGAIHMQTGKPILYTSADSVFQIAAHEEIVEIEELYRWCEIARELLQGKDQVGRVIARPFIGQPGKFKRTEGRRDFAVEPPASTLLDILHEKGLTTISVGKIASIFSHRGFTQELPGANNEVALRSTIEALKTNDWQGLVFTNLVDFDMLYGHRNDLKGYAQALEEFDAQLPDIWSAMQDDDLLILTADHGCDPTTPSTDHSREYVPILVYGKHASAGISLGTRNSAADIGKTIAENFGLMLTAGRSFLQDIAYTPS